MEDHRTGGQVAALQVRVEGGQLVRQHHALVTDGMRGECDHVEIGDVTQALFGAAARQEQGQAEGVVVLAVACIDEQLFDMWQRVLGQLSAHRVVGRQHAPATHGGTGATQFFFQHGAGLLGLFGVMRQEHQASGIAWADFDTGFAGQRAQEGIGFADQQATAVAC